MLMFDKTEKTKTEQKELMTEKEAFQLIREWADDLEVRLKDEDFEDLQREIWLEVKKERLSYDPDSETFNYVLKKPILTKDGAVKMSMIKIIESDMNGKRNIKKHKEDIDTVAEMFKSYCRDSEGNEIELGFITRIKDRDQAIISAVILGFFVQAVPSSK